MQKSIEDLQQNVVELNNNIGINKAEVIDYNKNYEIIVNNKFSNLNNTLDKSFTVVEERFKFCLEEIDMTKQRVDLIGSVVFPDK